MKNQQKLNRDRNVMKGESRRMTRRRSTVVLAGFVALFGIGVLSAPGVPAATHTAHLSFGISHQAAQPRAEIRYACEWSQIWANGGTIDGHPLHPCDGVYINCWTIINHTLYDWVSWTSRYGWTYQGYVNDYYIDTGNATTYYWQPC